MGRSKSNNSCCWGLRMLLATHAIPQTNRKWQLIVSMPSHSYSLRVREHDYGGHFEFVSLLPQVISPLLKPTLKEEDVQNSISRVCYVVRQLIRDFIIGLFFWFWNQNYWKKICHHIRLFEVDCHFFKV